MKVNLEQRRSSHLHQSGLPFLISPKFLRACHCGQVDVARVKSCRVELFEIKTCEGVSHLQKLRLRKSAQLISEIMELETKLIFLVGH